MSSPALAFGLAFPDLYRRDGLERLDAAFLATLAQASPDSAARLAAARARPPEDRRAEAELLIELAPYLERFLAQLFGIEAELAELRERHEAAAPLFRVKWKFVKRQALLRTQPAELEGFDAAAAEREIERWIGAPFDELAFARAVLAWQAERSDEAASRLETARLYSAWAVLTDAGRLRHPDSVLFRHPRQVEPLDLLQHARSARERGATVFSIRPEHIRRRAGFGLTDPGGTLHGALDEANYCLLCHSQRNDSCSRGLRARAAAAGGAGGSGEAVEPAGNGSAEAGASAAPAPLPFQRSAFGLPLAGCPLEERISEFHALKKQGLPVAALATIAVDNPMVAATGHRICNDCVKACVYQQQTPVDIPRAETRTLRDVLELPWGFEIYSLLTRWNPLDLRRPLPRPASGRKVLVAGMGPAGFTLAHHLLNEGHAVFGVDGLKIEPLPARLSGVAADGSRVPFEAIEDVEELFEALDDRVTGGFGGVAEYGITVRWDKNFLKLVRLLLERREDFALAGGVRLGSTLSIDDALALGFDHVALALGAGRPTMLEIPGGLARGVRAASDFLMALQLTGAAKADSVANMQLRLPVLVIGGGLTAIDTATESLAYYPVQVEKFLDRYETLCRLDGEAATRAGWTAEEAGLADEWLAHARAIREERAAAAREGRPARMLELLQSWGGATIAYRRRLVDSPAYTLNHEEVEKALEEGVRIVECVEPVAVEADATGAARAVRLRRRERREDGSWTDGAELEWPARSVFVAAGTQPNAVIAREEPGRFAFDGRHFRPVDEAGLPADAARGDSKPAEPRVLLSRAGDGRMLSFFGDLHPSWSGNVVRAMGSAKQGYPVVSRVLASRPPQTAEDFAAFSRRLRTDLSATVERVEQLAPGIVEVVLRAPAAARRFRPGQFYRLQNFETLAPRVEVDGRRTTLAMEALALTGAWVDAGRGLLSTIVLEMGGSSNLCALLRPGEPVTLMGPTGAPTEIAAGETVVLAGGGLGNAVLFSIGAAFRAAGSKVLYFAGYRRAADRFKAAEIEAAADRVVWCCDEAPGFSHGRPQDRSFVGNIVDAMLAWAEGRLADLDGPDAIRLQDADRIVAIGSDRMMAAVALARRGPLARHLKPGHRAIGSINSPMQCMMKEICAQCLQPRVDPVTGRTRYVFSCAEQDQPLDEVDFAALHQRLSQNSLQEKLTARWLAHCLAGLRAGR